MGVAREIGERGFRPGEGSLGVDDPLGAAQRRERGVESALVGERRQIAEEGQAAGLVERGEAFEKEAAEQAREDARKKPGMQAVQRDPSGDTPPPGTMTWTCG